MYQVAGLRLDFGDSYSAYGILQRDPSQFFGSVSSARYVKIDSKNKRFDNDLYRRLFGNVGGIDNTANLMFIGRTTGLWFNGDFDGDTFQAMVCLLYTSYTIYRWRTMESWRQHDVESKL